MAIVPQIRVNFDAAQLQALIADKRIEVPALARFGEVIIEISSARSIC
jgi:hypothetical protein